MGMNIREQLQQTLDSINPANVKNSQPQTVTLAHHTGQFDAELVALDSMACRATNVQLLNSRFEKSSMSELRQVAQQLASRLIYLLEPITPIEIDEDQVTVQLRSNPPLRDEDGRQYYELLVSRSGLRLCRYRQAAEKSRENIPADLTREILCRLAEDFLTV